MMKRLLLTLMLVVAVQATMSAADYDFKVGDVYYRILSDSTVAVSCRVAYYGTYSGDIVVPETVTYEGVDYTVTAVTNFAFYDSYSLTSVQLPNTIKSLGMSSFLRCVNLTSIEIPNSVERIMTSAFSKCSGLTSIYIPSSVTRIEGNVFNECPNLSSIVVAEDNPKYDSRENCNAVIETASNLMIIGCKNTVIPASVTSFGSWVFAGTTGFTSFEIPFGTTSVPSYMLAWCTNLTSVVIPNTVTYIGYDAFRNCTSLAHIDLPNSVTYIDIGAFSSMSSLESLEIPSNVYYIGEGFLTSSGALTSLSVAADNEYYDSREDCNAIILTSENKIVAGCRNTVFPSSVTSIAYAAFCGCLGMTNIDIPNTITSIGEHAFNACHDLEYATLPDSLTVIDECLFYNCENLKSITIPVLVTDVGDNAFRLDYSLKKVVCLPTTPPTLTRYTFYECCSSATLFVPLESVEAYQADELWGKFSRIVPFIGAGPGDVDGDGNIGINDVTTLIDQLLSDGEQPAWMDVNGDGVIGIADVTMIIDMLLNCN